MVLTLLEVLFKRRRGDSSRPTGLSIGGGSTYEFETFSLELLDDQNK